MRTTFSLLKSRASASSSRWIARQQKDPYVKSRLSSIGNNRTSYNENTSGYPSYRSRSSFKLLSLAQKHPSILDAGRIKVVVDLGAAPGGWTQVASHLLHRNGRQRIDDGLKAKIFALDILDMEAIPNVEVIRGDFLSEQVRNTLQMKIGTLKNTDPLTDPSFLDQVEGTRWECGVDTVLSDMMAPMSGNRLRNVQLSLQLCAAATIFARATLKCAREGEEVKKIGNKRIWPGGNLVIKFFAHPDMDEFRSTELDPWFSKVVVEKPKESRAESSEAYWVCLGFKGDPATR
ncbi:uncharacterized protein I303_103417 [Kwoniella dejecticola CBS 10117]|uniref:rRNA methyltransferase 2, mitochondrial n=1 Tax=Kwoniella dejecticola CBS 10117 TaxID=1296121 RepID=A0A1A6A6Q4_9TREE|nr:ribosomal RNA large subunit methyltransferase J [Kwoniella dejecticola CBS 10117]OBR85728.1 ribosomal RNA large subunit methyltransferase J [Kwoniella dejecticola CBS 10117]